MIQLKRQKRRQRQIAVRIASEAEAEANRKVAASVTDKLIESKLADARGKHGWVTVQGADTVVAKEK